MAEVQVHSAPAHHPERSVGELIGDLTRETVTLMRQEINLARAEMTKKATEVGKDIGFLVAGGTVAFMGALVLLAALVLGLWEAGLSPWLAALIVGLVVSGIGGFLMMSGLAALKKFDPVPHQTVETLQELKNG